MTVPLTGQLGGHWRIPALSQTPTETNTEHFFKEKLQQFLTKPVEFNIFLVDICDISVDRK